MDRSLRVTREILQLYCLAAALATCALVPAAGSATVTEAAEAAEAAETGSGSAFVVQVEEGRLTLQADGVPLGEVLEAIGAAGRFEVTLRGGFAAPVHESIAGEPLEDAIRRLVRDHPLVMFRRPAAEGETHVLVGIRVVERDKPDESPPAEAASDVAPSGEEGDGADDLRRSRAASDDRMSPRFDWAPTKDNILVELSDPEPETRIAAIPKVGSLRPRDAFEVLADVFSSEEDMLVRSRGIAALARLGTRSAGVLLRQQALGDPDPALRKQALTAIAASAGAERSISTLGRAMRLDSEHNVRLTAIRSLQRVGGDRARFYLEQAAADPDLAISAAAEQALSDWPERTN